MQEITKQNISKAIDNLPKMEKMVLSLYYSDDLTFKEISRVLSIPHSTTLRTYKQAINRIFESR